jgi:hypothetical protein
MVLPTGTWKANVNGNDISSEMRQRVITELMAEIRSGRN